MSSKSKFKKIHKNRPNPLPRPQPMSPKAFTEEYEEPASGRSNKNPDPAAPPDFTSSPGKPLPLPPDDHPSPSKPLPLPPDPLPLPPDTLPLPPDPLPLPPDDPELRALFAATPLDPAPSPVPSEPPVPSPSYAQSLPPFEIPCPPLPAVDPFERDITSTLHTRLQPWLRDRVDRAILDKRFGGQRAIYRYFQLAAWGISIAAFFRYARRLRKRAVRLDVTDLTPAESERAPSNAALLLIQRLLESLVLGNPSPSALEKLTRACYLAVRMEAFIREQNNRIYPRDPGRPDPDPEIEAAHQEALAAVQALRQTMAEGDAVRDAVYQQLAQLQETPAPPPGHEEI